MALQGNPLKCSCENTWLAKWLLRWMRETLQLHTSVVERGQNVQSIVRKITCKVSNMSTILYPKWRNVIFLSFTSYPLSFFYFLLLRPKLLTTRKTHYSIQENLNQKPDQQDQSLQMTGIQIP